MRWSKRQIRKCIQPAAALLAAWLVLLAVASETSAALYQWNGSVDSNWQTAANWNGGQVPGFNWSYFHRLNVNGSKELVYDASLGTTVYDGSVGSGGRGLVIGSSTGDGTMRITGGTFSTAGAASPDVVGNSGYTGILIIDGGNYINSAGFDFGTGGTGKGSLVINSGSVTITALQMNVATATIDLNGGILKVNSISRPSGTGTFNFNGGTLRAGGNSETFMQGLSRANIRNGGALVDTNGYDITIGQDLLHSNIDGDAAIDGGLTKQGAGVLTLSGANTYTGETSLQAGTLRLSHSLALQNSALNYDNQGGTIDFGSLTSATIGGLKGSQNVPTAGLTSLTLNPGDGVTKTYGGVISNGSATLSLTKSGAGTQVLTAANTYTGGTTVTGGILRITDANALGTTNGETSVASGARLELQGGITVAGKSITIHDQGGNAYGALQNASGSNTWSGGVVIGSAGTRIGSYSGTLTVSGVISGNYGLIVRNNGAGCVTVLAGENTYTGATQVVGGTTKIDGGHNRLPIGTTLQLGLSWASAEFDLNGWNQEVAGLQITQISDVFNNVVTNSSATPSILTVNQSASNSFSGMLTGSLSLTKAGSGTLTLTGNSTHSGTTVVSGGTLALSHASNNNIASSSLMQVGSGATLNVTGLTGGTLALATGQSLGGNGTVVGNVDVLGGAALAPGASAGTLNLGGNLTFAEGAYFDVDIESLDLADLVQMSGGLLAVDDATIRVNLGFSPEVGDSWTILQGEGDLTGQFNPTVDVLSGLAHLDGWKFFEVSYGNSVVLTVVPEPGTWLLLLCGLACGLLVRRRK